MHQESSSNALKYLDLIQLSLRFPRLLRPGEASHLRGFFGQLFAEEVMLHHHEVDGRLRYEYPKVQFKVLDQTAQLIGLAEGADLVKKLWTDVDQARIGSEVLPILESGIRRREEPFGESQSPLLYRFRTPWLGLNQMNHQKYESTVDPALRLGLLQRALIGNCLSLAKGFGHLVRARLVADLSQLRPIQTGLKGVPMVGFVGIFRVNFHIPDHAGIGKSVSRGFGTVERMDEHSYDRSRPC